jgi:hypothetical protein
MGILHRLLHTHEPGREKQRLLREGGLIGRWPGLTLTKNYTEYRYSVLSSLNSTSILHYIRYTDN